MTAWIIGALLGAADLANASAPAEPTSQTEPTRSESLGEVEGSADPRPERPVPGRNAMVLGTHAKIPDWALSLSYQRVLGRRFSLGFGLEYGFQADGYWHLQGVGETLSGQVWFGRPFQGTFAEGSMTLAHQFLVRQPRLSTTSLVPGVGLGYRYTHRSGLTFGGSAGLRWGHTVIPSSIVCTRPKYCTSVRQGAYTRITLDVGFVF